REARELDEAADALLGTWPRVSPGAVLAQSLRRPAHPAGRRGAPERNDPLRRRSDDLGARSELPRPRGRQSLRRRRELLSVERRGEPGAHDHGERVAHRGPSETATRLNTAAATDAGYHRGLVSVRAARAGGRLMSSGAPVRV